MFVAENETPDTVVVPADAPNVTSTDTVFPLPYPFHVALDDFSSLDAPWIYTTIRCPVSSLPDDDAMDPLIVYLTVHAVGVLESSETLTVYLIFGELDVVIEKIVAIYHHPPMQMSPLPLASIRFHHGI